MDRNDAENSTLDGSVVAVFDKVLGSTSQKVSLRYLKRMIGKNNVKKTSRLWLGEAFAFY